MKKFIVAILTSEKSWFYSYAKVLTQEIKEKGLEAKLFTNHEVIDETYNVVFILSYTRIIEEEFLVKHTYNLVIHASDLPQGKGWAPLFWQLLEGKNKIPIVLFEAQKAVDSGKIFLKDYLDFEGHELNIEIRKIQAMKTFDLCFRFLEEHEKIKPIEQTGMSTFYKRRTPKDSELNIHKPIIDQFNLLRIVNNEEFPAFFYYNRRKYILKIEKTQ